MFLNIGKDIYLLKTEIIGIFNCKNMDICKNKNFIDDKQYRSFIVDKRNNRIFSSFESNTLIKRWNNSDKDVLKWD